MLIYTELPSLTPNSAGYQIVLLKNQILDPLRSDEPSDIKQVRNAIENGGRKSPVPSITHFKQWRSGHRKARNEEEVKFSMKELFIDWRYRKVKDNGKLPGYISEFGLVFNNIPKNAAFNEDLAFPKVDYVEGLEQRSYEPFPLDDINGAAAVSIEDQYPTAVALPRLIVKFKGPQGSNSSIAQSQTAHAAACAVYGHSQVLEHIERKASNHKIVVFSIITDGYHTTIYGHHATKSKNGDIKYHQNPLLDLPSFTTTYESYKDARRMLRNVQDLARERSELFRDMLLEVAEKRPPPLLSPKEAPSAKRRRTGF